MLNFYEGFVLLLAIVALSELYLRYSSRESINIKGVWGALWDSFNGKNDVPFNEEDLSC